MINEDFSDVDSKAGGPDTEPDDALSAVRSFCEDVANQQGGTEITPITDNGKGNSDKFDLSKSERVNSDPQSFKWTDRPREDSADYEPPDFGY